MAYNLNMHSYSNAYINRPELARLPKVSSLYVRTWSHLRSKGRGYAIFVEASYDSVGISDGPSSQSQPRSVHVRDTTPGTGRLDLCFVNQVTLFF